MSIALPLRSATSRRPIAYGKLDDGRLAELAAAADERAFEAIFDRHHAPLLAFCRHMLSSREEGEDALQQTFLRAHRSLVDHGAPDELRPWLYAIARNRCRSALVARRDAAVPVENIEVSTDGLADEVQQRAELREIVMDLARLPEDQRGALVLAELGDLSHKQIADVLGCPVARVKALVFQAREGLLADREARAIPCATIREELATARGAALRRGPLKRHLRSLRGLPRLRGGDPQPEGGAGVHPAGGADAWAEGDGSCLHDRRRRDHRGQHRRRRRRRSRRWSCCRRRRGGRRRRGCRRWRSRGGSRWRPAGEGRCRRRNRGRGRRWWRGRGQRGTRLRRPAAAERHGAAQWRRGRAQRRRTGIERPGDERPALLPGSSSSGKAPPAAASSETERAERRQERAERRRERAEERAARRDGAANGKGQGAGKPVRTASGSASGPPVRKPRRKTNSAGGDPTPARQSRPKRPSRRRTGRPSTSGSNRPSERPRPERIEPPGQANSPGRPANPNKPAPAVTTEPAPTEPAKPADAPSPAP